MAETDDNKKVTPQSVLVFRALAVLVLAFVAAYFVYSTSVGEGSRFPFKYGLDLAGGSQLVYVADVSAIREQEVPELMNVLREVIERRINVFGVSEPNVQVETSSFVTDNKEQRLIVELPGVTDLDEAVKQIGQTPLLEFKLVDQEVAAAEQALEANFEEAIENGEVGVEVVGLNDREAYIDTGLTGRYLQRADLVFGQANQGGLSNEPIVSITFTDEGGELFAKITRENVGEFLAIFLDGELVSSPRINESITGGKAIISGNFTAEEARSLVRNLNFGSLPVPIKIDSTQSIGAVFGEEALNAGVYAGVVGFVLLSAFMILWYRLSGVVSVMALITYVIMMLVLFKVVPVVLTAAGIAGLILSIGLAVDANILIAERIKEELRSKKPINTAIEEGFKRAWLAIRDANITSLIAAVILFWFGTSLVKGFALVLGVGVAVSMLSAIVISRTLLMAIPVNSESKIGRFLMGSGFSR